jgi:hypothetical protein
LEGLFECVMLNPPQIEIEVKNTRGTITRARTRDWSVSP